MHAAPLRLLFDVGRRYRAAWDHYARLRADRKALGDWPAWCHCPMAGGYAIVDELDGNPADIAVVAAAAAGVAALVLL